MNLFRILNPCCKHSSSDILRLFCGSRATDSTTSSYRFSPLSKISHSKNLALQKQNTNLYKLIISCVTDIIHQNKKCKAALFSRKKNIIPFCFQNSKSFIKIKKARKLILSCYSVATFEKTRFFPPVIFSAKSALPKVYYPPRSDESESVCGKNYPYCKIILRL